MSPALRRARTFKRGSIWATTVFLLSVALADGGPDVSRHDQLNSLFSHELVGHWQRRDANGLASLWTEDGEWMNLIGSRRLVRSRKGIAEVWAVGLEGRDKADDLLIDVYVDSVLPLADDLAQVDLVMVFGTPPNQIGEAMLAITRWNDNRWLIESARVARLPD